MSTYNLITDNGHVYIKTDNQFWLYDTGAPTSFGESGTLSIGGDQFKIASNYMGLDSNTLSEFVGRKCNGLLGSDILNQMDHLIDTLTGNITLSANELSHNGQHLSIDEFMGIPIVTVSIGSGEYRMFFDTGAQISYFQDETITGYPCAGTMTDFYPGIGRFQTETHEVPVLLGGAEFLLRCGRLPGLLGMTLMMADTNGIVGNAILNNRLVGYFPRRGILSL